MQAAADSLRLLLQRLVARYPDAPQSRRAEAMLTVLDERARADSSAARSPQVARGAGEAAPKPAPSDTTAAGPSASDPPAAAARAAEGAPDPTAADTTGADAAVGDRRKPQADSAATPRADGEGARTITVRRRSRSRADTAASGRGAAWTIVAAEPARRAAADSLAEEVRGALGKGRTVTVVSVSPADGRGRRPAGRFQVTVGTYDSRQRAAAELRRLRGRYPEAQLRRRHQPADSSPRP
jgi:hypothetical protein